MKRNASEAELTAAFPGRKYFSICRQARNAGYGAKGHRRLRTGIPFWDAIYHEADRKKLCNSAIDRLAGTKTAFEKQSSLYDHHFIRAAEAMGGVVTIVWDD